jgi:integrase
MLQFVIAFLLLTGARKREALDAKWSHFDFERATWTIPLSKSGKPRYVPLSPSASDVLKKLQAYSFRVMGYRWQDCEWVFPNPRTRKPFINIFFAWNRARQRAGLPDVRIHDLRHSFASALANEGMTLYDVKELLGHSNMATTTRYAHLSNKRLHTVAAVAGQHFCLEKDFSSNSSDKQ